MNTKQIITTENKTLSFNMYVPEPESYIVGNNNFNREYAMAYPQPVPKKEIKNRSFVVLEEKQKHLRVIIEGKKGIILKPRHINFNIELNKEFNLPVCEWTQPIWLRASNCNCFKVFGLFEDAIFSFDETTQDFVIKTTDVLSEILEKSNMNFDGSLWRTNSEVDFDECRKLINKEKLISFNNLTSKNHFSIDIESINFEK